MRRLRRSRIWPAVAGSLALALSGASAAASASPGGSVTRQTTASTASAASGGTGGTGGAVAVVPATSVNSGADRVADPDHVLGEGWQKSADRAVTAIGDSDGLDILVADASAGYQWRVVTSLSEPGFDSSQWIGQDCVTGSGRYAAVVYAPWSFANSTDAVDHGGFAAVVDLATGAVRKLPDRVSLAYYSPGCGTDDTVVFSAVTEGRTATTTRLDSLDAATGRKLHSTVVPGQATSPVPYAGGIAAALGDSVITVAPSGARSTLATEDGIPFDLRPDAHGGLAMAVPAAGKVQLWRLGAATPTMLGTVDSGGVQLQGTAGRVFVAGPEASRVSLTAVAGDGWSSITAPSDTTVSTEGGLALTAVAEHAVPDNGARQAISIDAAVTRTGKTASFAVDPTAVSTPGGHMASPALTAFASTTAKAAPGAKTTAGANAATVNATSSGYSTTDANDGADPSTASWDPVRGCAVARNDPSIQTLQANAKQIEWAADLAVQGKLTVARGPNWKGSGIQTSWTPQQMFPLQPLAGGGSVPVQVLLGVLAQESNTLQASPHAVDGQTGNVNQGGFYGNVNGPVPPGTSFSDVDCGYGVGQITTGMTIGTTTRPANGSTLFSVADEQQAIATDYASNIAATLNMLIDKWNQLYSLGIKANGGSPQYIENWWFALWAYNSGVQPSSAALGNTTGCAPGPTCTDNGGSGGNWGLGWANNPANPTYQSARKMFSSSIGFDTSHPQYWSYPERVLGWAATPLGRYDYAGKTWAPAYAAGHWPGNPQAGEPSHSAFCFPTVNHCTADQATDSFGVPDSAGLCALSNLHCWWHIPSTWVTSCASVCGTQVMTYAATSTEPVPVSIYPPDCNAGLPAGIVIVADATTASVGPCDKWWQNQGSFTLSFPYAPAAGCVSPCVDYPGKIDFHQVGDGFGGHLWFTHTQPTATVAATWTPPTTVKGWTRVLVHLPIGGAVTQQAGYTVGPDVNGQYEIRYVNEHFAKDTWYDLGVFDLAAGATVRLDNSTADGAGDEDIAFDAIGFVPLPAKPADFVVQLGDSYSSGTAAGSYLPNSAVGPYASLSGTSPGREWNACLRSSVSWIRDAELPRDTASIGALADSNAPSLDYHSVACNGALTNNVDTAVGSGAAAFGGIGQYHEVSQLGSGYLDSNTTLVALTIGGNDAGFGDTIKTCMTAVAGCPSDASVKQKIDAMVPNLEKVLTDITYAAPNAKIILLGYPELFNRGLRCAGSIGVDIDDQLDDWADYLEADQVKAVTTVNSQLVGAGRGPITFNWSNTEFVGAQSCDSPPGINNLVAAPASDNPADFSCPSSPICPSMESFHPTAIGAQRYALALEHALATARY